ncbi:MAG TPA: hypothetical protein PKV67_11510 [Hyphomonas sp.]|nr:hypothetical protein [Hyphomonas sp.]HRJ01394.1 hypothetical protein [Hyphomonas sp.]HRK67736.1 hypothetical protein [Hyphomonas sp.]
MADHSFKKIDEWEKDLFKEKTLWTVLKISAPYVGDPKEVRLLTILGAILCGCSVLSFVAFNDWFAAAERLRSIARESIEFTAPFYVGVFGFVFAGFSIIVSLFNGEALKVLASHRDEKRPFSELKHIYFTFIYVMSVLLAGLVASFLLYTLNQEGGILGAFQQELEWWAALLAISSIIVSVMIFLYTLLMIKSLIWSLYQLVLLSIAEKSKSSAGPQDNA